MASPHTEALRNELDGGEAIVEAFRNLGVDYVISSPGSEWPPVWEAFARQQASGANGPTYLDCGHETLAVCIAAGYTRMTGRMQAVLLHAGSGLLQGAIGIQGARATEVPMLVMSGESLSYGERPDFDPGNQWYRNLGVVGGPQRLLDPLVKWGSQVPSIETLYQSVVRAGEMAQRVPQGPVYLNVPLETMLDGWIPARKAGLVPPVPKRQPLNEDLQHAAAMIAGAKKPIIVTESAGRDLDAFKALIALAELMAIPVFEGRAASCSNFPKSHGLHLGLNAASYRDEADLILLIESRVPWYPPSNAPLNATIVAISENPLKDHMVYQNLAADLYLEGNVGVTLRLLTSMLVQSGENTAAHSERRAFYQAQHDAQTAKRRALQQAATGAAATSMALLCKVLNDVLPRETIFVDETIVHSPIIRELLDWNDYGSFMRTPSGLGQGCGLALGAKLAARDRPVVLLIGDGSFLYNPVLSALAFAKDLSLPIMIVVCNNQKYEIMRTTHLNWYPHGVAATKGIHFGVNLATPDYADLADWIGGLGQCVTEPAALADAVANAYAAVTGGKSAILNVMLSE